MGSDQKGFLLYLDNYDLIEDMSNEEKGEWINAVFRYKRYGEIPGFQKGTLLNTAFKVAKSQLDRDSEAWEEKRQKRAEAGQKGGLAKSSNAKQSRAEASNAKQGIANLAVNVKGNGNVNGNVNVIGNVNKKDICTEPEESVSMPPVLSLILNDNTLHSIFQSDIDGWKELYPAVDVIQELRKMKGWLDSNPTKRKTQKGIRRFINGWLAREQDRSGTRGNAESFQGVFGNGGDIGSLPVGTDISESGEEIEAEIYRIVSRRISPEAIERYTDKMHELIRLCCLGDDFSQKQINYMRKEWGIEPVKKEDALIPPRTDNFPYWDARLYEDDTN